MEYTDINPFPEVVLIQMTQTGENDNDFLKKFTFRNETQLLQFNSLFSLPLSIDPRTNTSVIKYVNQPLHRQSF